MKKAHGSSRRQAYGRRMKELRARRGESLEVDLEGPDGWSRGDAWDEDRPMHRASLSVDDANASLRTR